MELTLRDKACKFVNFNPRPELHGEEPVPAADLHFSMDVPNDHLTDLHPDLKGVLYIFDSQRLGDLVDKAKKHEEGYLPHLRFPKLKTPLKWDEELIACPVSVKYANEKVTLADCVVGDIKIEPQEGGTVTIGFRVQAHPKEKDAGRLYIMAGQTVKVSIGKSRIGDEQPTSEE